MLDTKICKLSTCSNTVPSHKSKYCSERCSAKFFTDKTRLEKKKIREQNEIVRFCLNENCGKQLPNTAHHQKKYCPETDCYRKQNALDAKRKKEAKKAREVIRMVVCNSSTCEKEYPEHKRQKYCCPKCRKAQNFQVSKVRLKEEGDTYQDTKDEAVKRTGSKKDIAINPMFLSRGLR